MEHIDEKYEKFHPDNPLDARWAADAPDVAARRRNQLCGPTVDNPHMR